MHVCMNGIKILVLVLEYVRMHICMYVCLYEWLKRLVLVLYA